MFTLNSDDGIKSGDIIDGRLFQYVAISSFRQLIAATWALLLILALQYGANVICRLIDFSFSTAIRDLPADLLSVAGFDLMNWLVLGLSPFGHISRIHFALEMICLVFLTLHAANVLGQFTTLLVILITPYAALFMLFVLGEPSLAVGTISASAALLTVSMIASAQNLFNLGRPQLVILLILFLIYLWITPFGTIFTMLSGVSIGVLVSYISQITLDRSETPNSPTLLAITYYYVPLRFAVLAIPMTAVLLFGAFFVGKN